MGTLCLSGQAVFKAGTDVSTSITEDQHDQAISEAESYIYGVMRNDLSGSYATMDISKRLLLQRACSDLAAISLIEYDMSGFPALSYATTTIYFLWNDALLTLNLLKDKKTQDFIT